MHTPSWQEAPVRPGWASTASDVYLSVASGAAGPVTGPMPLAQLAADQACLAVCSAFEAGPPGWPCTGVPGAFQQHHSTHAILRSPKNIYLASQ